MAKSPTVEQIKSAFEHAAAGRGGPLARLVKSFSIDDLAAAFGRYPTDLINAVCFAAGMKQERETIAAETRVWRRKLRQDRRS